MRKLIFILSLLLLSCSNNNSSIITNRQIKTDVKESLKAKTALFSDSSMINTLLSMDLDSKERDAVEFLFAYAPLADMNVDSSMVLDHVRASLKRRESVQWRDSISDDMFLYYVLPHRVYNEPMDEFRTLYSDEIAARVEGMSMREAALELNHWCQERVIYGSSDARTSSPLQSLKTAFGRCGEESVFAVAVMRAAGLPARQVYAPRWSHSDDNHAWIEVFTGDGWHYMGACEPEPVLDRGWFSSVATRSMLMIAKVYGNYYGTEEVIAKYPNFTEINVTENYAPVKSVSIKVIDSDGAIVEGAKVEFRIFNYAQLSVVATKYTDHNGLTSMKLGLGDIMVYASDGDLFGIERLAVADMDSIEVKLQYRAGDDIDLQLNFAPPVGSSGNASEVTEQMIAANKERVDRGSEIRNSYVATFPDADKISEIAKKLAVQRDHIQYLIESSRGNSSVIIEFLESLSKDDLPYGIEMMESMPLKDLRDITLSSLSDAVVSLKLDEKIKESDLFVDYILNPRISLEPLKPYKVAMDRAVEGIDIEQIKTLCRAIKIDDDQNFTANLISPIDVMATQVSDRASRDLYFVAMCRANGVAARLDMKSKIPQYFDCQTSEWVDVEFDEAVESSSEMGSIDLMFNDYSVVADPKYFTHFTLAKLDGVELQTVDMPRNINVDMGGGVSYASLFAKEMSLREGDYLVISGNRLSSGEVLTQIKSFSIASDKKSSVELNIPDLQHDFTSVGEVDLDINVINTDGMSEAKLSSFVADSKSDYFILALIQPGAEPTNHALRGLRQISKEIDSWDGEVVVALESKEVWEKYNSNEFGKLPISHYVIDLEQKIANYARDLKLQNSNLPLFVVASRAGKVYFVSQGYQINLPDNLKRVIEWTGNQKK